MKLLKQTIIAFIICECARASIESLMNKQNAYSTALETTGTSLLFSKMKRQHSHSLSSAGSSYIYNQSNHTTIQNDSATQSFNHIRTYIIVIFFIIIVMFFVIMVGIFN